MEFGSYLLAVEVEAMFPMEDLRSGLQSAYDAGADGAFEIAPTGTPGFMVLFLRSTRDEDAQYLVTRMRQDGVDVFQAARAQLAAELAEGAGEHVAVQAVVSQLQSGAPKCIQFFGGALDQVARLATGA